MNIAADAAKVVRNDCIVKIDMLSSLIRNGTRQPKFKELPTEMQEESDNLKKALSPLFLQISRKNVGAQEIVEVDESIEQIYVIYKQVIDTLKACANAKPEQRKS